MSTPSEDQEQRDLEADGETGALIANVLAMQMNGVTARVAYNAIGSLVCRIFEAFPFDQPGDVMIEFDNWVKYTRAHIEATMKGKLS